MVMRPKSMATVVVSLPGTLEASSTPTPAEVISASVVSGVISEMAPTNVVLPTPKPPAMTIFADVTLWPPLERAKSNENPLQHVDPLVGVIGVDRLMQFEQAVGDHVGHQHPGDAERKSHVRGDFGQGLGRLAAQLSDAVAVAARVRRFADPALRRQHDRLDGDLAGGL